jgi:anaerobic ribonucleoside-triphosphate reductase activating protein
MIRTADVIDESIVDGEGLRLVVFAQGCAHHCPGCHNPSALPFEGGYLTDNEAILLKIIKNPLLDGITFSGGDPFFQVESFASLAKAVNENIVVTNPDFTIMAYTGYTLEELFKDLNRYLPLLDQIDILVDGPYIASSKSLELSFIGSLNQRILDVKKSLLAKKPVLYVLE